MHHKLVDEWQKKRLGSVIHWLDCRLHLSSCELKNQRFVSACLRSAAGPQVEYYNAAGRRSYHQQI
jgi:hypothetical protein